MAVSFKVPASPKRNISASDTFIGVDLTNTAVDMEGTRSPNAENMVRHVPGKVRKRMGYYKEILFGKKTNVNFLDGTSAYPLELLLNTPGLLVNLYNTIQPIGGEGTLFTVYVEFDYKAEAEFDVYDVLHHVPASDDWAHYSESFTFLGTRTINSLFITSSEIQNIAIKNCALMLEKDENYTWSPAPKYFVERATNDPIYGCHFLKNGKDSYNGDRVVNVNRALNTSSEFTTYDLSSLVSGQDIIDLNEIPGDGTTVYVEFDYIFTGSDIDFYICHESIEGSLVQISDTSGETEHMSYSFTMAHSADITSSFNRKVTVYANSIDATRELKIKNFSVMYEKNDDYEWSAAPEDSDKKFTLTDLYSTNPTNYALMTAVDDDATPAPVADKYYVVGDNNEKLKNGAHLSFDIQVSTTKSAGLNIIIYLSDGTNTKNIFLENTQLDPDTFYKKHLDFYFKPYDDSVFLRGIRLNMVRNTSSTTKVHTYVSNIELQSYTVRESYYISPKWYLYHVGEDMYLNAPGSRDFKKVLTGANRHISKSWQLNNNSYIIDGKNIYYFSIEDGETVEPIDQNNAYIPLVTFAKSPSGGGTSQYALNMLQPGFYEQFIGESGVTEYQLSFSGLDETPCKAWILDNNGNWNPKVEGTDFTVNRGTGKVTFTTAPGETPVTGEDSVRILAYRTIDDYRDRVTKCTVGVLFGVAGASDRIFLSGNPDHPNWDFYSQQYDPTYFPDLGYSVLGSEQSRIMGYAIVNNYLTTFKDGFETAQSVFVREGDLLKTGEEEKETSEPVFKLINTLQGEGVLAPYTFGYLQTEPLFLTKAGIYAITEQDITGEKYTQNRSFYLDGTLRKEPNLEDAIATVYDNQYILAVNNQLFVLDGLQATRTDKSEPYATRQYAGFYCTNVPATYIWSDDALCFGTADGRVCRFYTDEKSPDSYNDDGKAIYACWETPDLDGQLFYKNKTFRYFAVRLMKAVKTSVKMLSEKSGIWTLIKEDVAVGKAPDFENWDFETFSFSCDESERLLHSKVRVKKVDKARFRVENDKVNEPFGLSDLALEYIESGNYKG